MKSKEAKAFRQRLQPPRFSTRTTRLLTVGLLLFATLGLHLLCQLIGTLDFSGERFCSYFDKPVLLALNFLPVLVLVALAYFLTNRAWLALLLPGAVLVVLEFVNYFKIALRGDPFTVEDFTLIGEAAGVVGNYTLRFPFWFFAALLLLLAGTLALAYFARGRIPKRLWWVRLAGVLLCVVVGMVSYTQWYSDTELYAAQRNYACFNERKDAEKFAAHGFVYSFLHSANDVFPSAPEGYSEERAQALLSAYADAEIPADRRVNVVVTMLESFSDLSALEGVEFTADAYEAFHALQAESYHGTLVSDTIGGATVNSERSFLTGFSYPQPRYRGETNSFVRYFSSQGYRTDGSHPGHDWFYDREPVNKNLGFDRYLFLENHYDVLAGEERATDEMLFGELARIYDEQTADGTPYFSFSVSYQNHSPYDADRLTGAEYVSHDGLTDAAYYQINNYLDGIADTGRQICAYVDTFRDNPEPVVLVFFGDHKPSFGTGNCDYEALGVSAEEGSPAGCWNLYTTPYLIWANDAAKEVLDFDFTGEGNTISPCFLMAELFDCCGWEGPAWMQYQRQTRALVPVLHRRSMFLLNGALTNTLPEREEQTRREFEIVQYYVRTKLYDGFE